MTNRPRSVDGSRKPSWVLDLQFTQIHQIFLSLIYSQLENFLIISLEGEGLKIHLLDSAFEMD